MICSASYAMDHDHVSTRVSSIVLCFNSERHIERCVRALLRDYSARTDEVWLIDNGSTDTTGAILDRLSAEDPSRIHVITLGRNFGTTVSRNIGIRKAAGRFIAVVDSDTELPAGAIDRMIHRLESEPAAGLVAPRLVYPDGRTQLSADLFPTVGRKIQRSLVLRSMETRERIEAGVRDVDYAISACWLVSRKVVDAVGLFDESIFYSPEDVDYCIRVWSAGYRVLYDGSIAAIHHAQELSRTLVPHWATFSHIAGLAYLYRKHRFGLSRRGLYKRIGRFVTPHLVDETQ
jgi:GT2 family glycosyltransferase